MVTAVTVMVQIPIQVIQTVVMMELVMVIQLIQMEMTTIPQQMGR